MRSKGEVLAKPLQGRRLQSVSFPPILMAKKKMKKTQAKKKVKKVSKLKKTKKKAKKSRVKKVKKVKAKKAKRVKAVRKAGKVKTLRPKALGKVIHYYDKIGVGIVKMAGPLSVGENVLLKRGSEELRQQVTSMQVDHTPVSAAKKGQVIGLKVNQPVREGAVLLKA